MCLDSPFTSDCMRMTPPHQVTNVWHVLGLLIESLMKGEPDHIMERTETHVAFAWY